MIILCDTRQKKWSHVERAFIKAGVEYQVKKLDTGDYMDADNNTLTVDRKAGLKEVQQNLIHSHERFRRQAERALNAEIRMVVLVEQNHIQNLDDVAHWHNPRAIRWHMVNNLHKQGKRLDLKIPAKPPIDGPVLEKIMQAFTDRYKVEWQFVPHKQCGKRIIEILKEGSEHDGRMGKVPQEDT